MLSRFLFRDFLFYSCSAVHVSTWGLNKSTIFACINNQDSENIKTRMKIRILDVSAPLQLTPSSSATASLGPVPALVSIATDAVFEHIERGLAGLAPAPTLSFSGWSLRHVGVIRVSGLLNLGLGLF